jgi:hypothetical protein
MSVISAKGGQVVSPGLGGNNGGKTDIHQQNVFRVSTYTQVMDTVLDTDSYILSISRDLQHLGQVTLSKTLVNASRVQASMKGDRHSELKGVALQAYLEEMGGSPRQALALLLANREDMTLLADGTLLSKFACTAAVCYSRIGERDEAKRVIQEALHLLDNMSAIPLPIPAPAAPPSSSATANRSIRNSVTSIDTGTAHTAYTKAVPIPEVERDMDCLKALTEIFLTYVDILVEECHNFSTPSFFDFKGALKTISNTADKVLSKISAVAGPVSLLSAVVLEKTSQASHTILLKLHTSNSTFGGLHISEYPHWYEEQLILCIKLSAEAVNIRRTLCARLSEDDLTYTIDKVKFGDDVKRPSASKVPPVKPVKPLTKKNSLNNVIEAIKPPDEDLSGEPVPKPLLTSLQVSLAKAECMLGAQKYHLGIFQGQNISVGGGQSVALQRLKLAAMTVPERFCFQSKPVEESTAMDFEVNPIGEGMLLASSAQQLLSSIGSEDVVGSSHGSLVESSVLYSAGLILQLNGANVFDTVWRSDEELREDKEGLDKGDSVVRFRPESELENGGDKNELCLVSREGVAARLDLSLQIISALSARKFDAAALGCCALVDAYGSRESQATACWLLQLQSIMSRKSLLQLWEASLNPACEAKRSLNRLRDLESQEVNGKGTEAELAFLMNSSVCWKRLDVNLDPSVILNTIPLNTVVICLQLCPYRQVLYACIGIRTVPSVLTTPAGAAGKKLTPAEVVAAAAAAEAKGAVSYSAGGDWAVSKVALSETNRRLLLTLTAQHTLWREDTTKFISKYGDCLAANGDLEGTESQHSDVKIRKTEAALEERLRALLSDMETVVEEVLGL